MTNDDLNDFLFSNSGQALPTNIEPSVTLTATQKQAHTATATRAATEPVVPALSARQIQRAVDWAFFGTFFGGLSVPVFFYILLRVADAPGPSQSEKLFAMMATPFLIFLIGGVALGRAEATRRRLTGANHDDT